MVAMLAITLIYLISGMLLVFESLIGRILVCVAVVGLVGYYQFYQGMVRGESDASFGEIMYQRSQEGKSVTKEDEERCFHPAKGFFAALMGAAPFVVFSIVLACIANPMVYTLGVLPSWTEGLLAQNEFGDALHYYTQVSGIAATDVMRVIDRAMVMPFINVAAYLGNIAALWAERLSPLLVLVAPLGYGLGYTQGKALRVKVNTGIQQGDEKKRRRERKARKQRQRSSTPERLI